MDTKTNDTLSKIKASSQKTLSQRLYERREATEKYNRLLREAKIPLRHKKPIPLGGKQKEKLANIQAGLGKGMLYAFLGTRGTGKTQMAAELIKTACANGVTAKYHTVMELFMELKETYKSHSTHTEAQVIRAFTVPQLLVLDEVHERGSTEWENRLLTYMIDKRYGQLRDTVLISNQTAEVFGRTIGNSILSRLHETGAIIVCDWKSFRQNY